MQSESKILDDLAKLASGAAGALHGLRGEAEAAFRARLVRIAAEMDLVPRDEFEAFREMALEAREHAAELEKRIAALEAKGGPAKKAAPARKRASAKRASTAKSKGSAA